MKHLWIVLTLSLTGCGGGCNQPGPPPPDSCQSAAVGNATSLELLTSEGLPIAEGQAVPLVWGPQGGEMIVIELQLAGDVPGCIGQESIVYQVSSGLELYSDNEPRKTYPAGSARVTKPIYLPLFDVQPGDPVRVVGRAGGLEAERTVYLDYVGTPDAGVNDALAPPDALSPDALSPDAASVNAAWFDAGA